MGRNSTGAVTTWAVLRIEMSYLLKQGLIKKGYQITTAITWDHGASVSIETSYNTKLGDYIRLIYSSTDREGIKTNHDYKIYLGTVPSNLGKGQVIYFLCPMSGIRCRILYLCYGSDLWKARSAYQNRIYYPSQKSSKMNHANDRYWCLDKEIVALRKNRRKQLTYKGQPTRFALRLERMRAEQHKLDIIRMQNFNKFFSKFF